jgi:hypothetical protein
MNPRALIQIIVPCVVGFAVSGLACSTNTPIGVVDTGTGGTPAIGTGGSNSAPDAGATAAGGSGADPAMPGHYVPTGEQVLNDPAFTNPTNVADWVGYLENYDLYLPGLDQIHLHFGADAQGNATLSVVRGMGTPPAPPTDPFQAWPAPVINDDGTPGVGVAYPEEPIAGFSYMAHRVVRTGARLKFSTLDAEPWTAWCNLQTSFPLPGNPGVYSCNAGNGLKGTGGNTCQFIENPSARCTLNHAMMCTITSQICSCNATGCGADAGSGTPYDITFFGDHAIGSVGNYNLILTPAP